MPSPILDVREPSSEIYNRIGRIAAEWGWVEMLLGEMLAHFCHADHGAMYVVTQSTATATMTNWLRTLVEIQVKNDASAKIISDLLTEVDTARATRNIVVHGIWRAADDTSAAFVQTFRWERQEVARDELWSVSDLDDFIDEIIIVQTMLANLGIKLGFLKLTAP